MNDRDLTRDYDEAGFGGALAFGASPALILVDMVLAYLDARSPLFLQTGADAVARARELMTAFEDRAAPIALTTVSYSNGLKEAGHFAKKAPVLKCFEEGSPLAAFAPDLQPPQSAHIVTKHYPSAFFGTSLASTLCAAGVDTVVIAGFSTSGCVRATALDALQHGFAPFVASDACADRDAGPHDANLFDLQAKYAEVKSTTEILSLLNSSP